MALLEVRSPTRMLRQFQKRPFIRVYYILFALGILMTGNGWRSRRPFAQYQSRWHACTNVEGWSERPVSLPLTFRSLLSSKILAAPCSAVPLLHLTFLQRPLTSVEHDFALRHSCAVRLQEWGLGALSSADPGSPAAARQRLYDDMAASLAAKGLGLSGVPRGEAHSLSLRLRIGMYVCLFREQCMVV